jgi:hypothetical protein
MFRFLKNLLFVDQKTKLISHTKWWSNVGYTILCTHFIWVTYASIEVDITLWVLFATVVVGNRTVMKMFSIKHAPKEEDNY